MGIVICVILLAVMAADTKEYLETNNWKNVRVL